MAKAYKCDRCGNFYSRMSNPAIWITIDRHPYPDETIVDLCDNCQQALKGWLESYMKEG